MERDDDDPVIRAGPARVYEDAEFPVHVSHDDHPVELRMIGNVV